MTERLRSFSALADAIRRTHSKQRGDGEDEPQVDIDAAPRSSALTPEQVADLAQQIVRAGAQRRGELPIDNPPPTISEASRCAGTATYQTPVRDPAAVAAAIIEAGKRRRGET